jgi:UDP-GlcNAc:undecaprenyl-phosphate GlcNAc-1-phosphate transferase
MTVAAAALVAAAVGAAVAVAAARLVTPLARRSGLVDPPGGRKLQSEPVPLVGGVALLLAGLSALLTGRLARPTIPPAELVASGAATWLPLAMMAVGILDDRSGKRLSAGWKAVLTLIALATALASGGGSGLLAFGAALVALFALVHATNTIDHVDGLCAGCSALALFAAGAAAAALGEDELCVRILALAGGAAGFLFLNFPRARVFLGDGGTLLLGGCLAWLWLHWRRPEVFLLATVPLADFLSVAWLRARSGGAPWIGDRRHVTHRLIARGATPTRAVLALLALQAAAATGGGWLLAHPIAVGAATAVTAAALLAVALAFLGVAPESA